MKKEIAKLPTKVVISNLISHVFYHVWRIKEDYLEEQGLNISAREIHTLSIVALHEGMPMKGIAELLKIDKSTLSINCRRLIEKDYLKKETKSNDKRSFTLALTDKGHEAVNINQKFHNQIVEEITDYSNQSENDVKDVLEGLMHYFSKRH